MQMLETYFLSKLNEDSLKERWITDMTPRKSEEKVVLYHYVHCPYCLRVRMALRVLRNFL